ncbi:MAG: zinc-dependent alcohol dehydrogenase family protein [Candidatus Bathyarchaeia archaeon]
MRAAVLLNVGVINVLDKELPALGERDVLLRVGFCGICGTDLHFFKGEWRVKTPLVLGHEFSGVVVEVGQKVQSVKAGDRVVVEPNITCGECKYCRMSDRNFFCENLEAIGVTKDGAFAEYVLVPERNVYKISGVISLEEAALVEPLACIIRGLDNVGIPVGSNVAVVGAGPIGLLMTQMANLCGATKVFVIDMIDDRLRLAEQLGAHSTANAKVQDPIEFVKRATNGTGVDISIECVGSASAVDTAFKLTRRGGRLLVFGVAPENDSWHVKPFELYDKEVSIFTSYRSPYTFQRAVEIASSGKLKLKPIISHVFPLEDSAKVFEDLAERKAGFLKVLLKP